MRTAVIRAAVRKTRPPCFLPSLEYSPARGLDDPGGAHARACGGAVDPFCPESAISP